MEKKTLYKIIFIPLAIIIVLGILFLIFAFVSFDKNSTSDYTSSELSSLSGTSSSLESSDSLQRASVDDESGISEDSSVIRTGSIYVAVDDIDSTLDSLEDLEDKYEASVVSLTDYGTGNERTISMSIKVEESKFSDLYNDIKGMDGEFERSSISESDVTDTVLDLEARLSNYRSVETQLLTILESATSVEDTLAVYTELNEVRYNIERTDAELKNLNNQTDYSYIYLYISQSSSGADISDEEWKPVGIFKEAAGSLVSFAKFLGSVLIWFLVFSPVVALVVVPIVVLKKKHKK